MMHVGSQKGINGGLHKDRSWFKNRSNRFSPEHWRIINVCLAIPFLSPFFSSFTFFSYPGIAMLKINTTFLALVSLIHFALADNVTSSGSSLSSIAYGSVSRSPISTTGFSSPAATYSPSGTGAGVNETTGTTIPIIPPSVSGFHLFPKPSDEPQPPSYLATDPSEPPRVIIFIFTTKPLIQIWYSGRFGNYTRFRACMGRGMAKSKKQGKVKCGGMALIACGKGIDFLHLVCATISQLLFRICGVCHSHIPRL